MKNVNFEKNMNLEKNVNFLKNENFEKKMRILRTNVNFENKCEF